MALGVARDMGGLGTDPRDKDEVTRDGGAQGLGTS